MRRAYRRLLAMVMALTLALSGTQIVTAASVETVNINLTYGQTEARSMLTYINQFRQSTQESPITIDSYNYTDYAWYLEEDNSTQTVVTGLGTVSYDYGLEMVAMQRAAEIAVRWAHSRPNGGEWYDVYSELGLSYSAAGENLAAGHSSVEFAFVGLAEKDKEYYDEQGHRRNTLDSRWAYVGIGHVVCNECHYWAIEYSSTATGVG
ncbi:MAG: CAP domain-containing protein, partial [Lachnospiraceae bacterium]|nr:CAP domain-containing protein [Lachnospiraceae bacterium]